jgi:hypothetical protein
VIVVTICIPECSSRSVELVVRCHRKKRTAVMRREHQELRRSRMLDEPCTSAIAEELCLTRRVARAREHGLASAPPGVVRISPGKGSLVDARLRSTPLGRVVRLGNPRSTGGTPPRRRQRVARRRPPLVSGILPALVGPFPGLTAPLPALLVPFPASSPGSVAPVDPFPACCLSLPKFVGGR